MRSLPFSRRASRGLRSRDAGEISSRLQDSRSRLEEILVENTVPFWSDIATRSETPGYELNHDRHGRYLGPQEKYAIAQSRMLWFFARLANSPYGMHDHREMADRGYQFLKEHLWDAKYGGVFWSLDPSGHTPTKDGKHLCAQVFSVYALCEYFDLTGIEEALSLAIEIFDLCEKSAHDGGAGGYMECFGRDWVPQPPDEKGYLGPAAGLKTVNTHIHVLEAWTSLYRATGDVRVRDRVHELSEILVIHAFVGPNATTVDIRTADWSPVSLPSTISYGHALETIWLLLAASRQAEIDPTRTIQIGRSVFRAADRYVLDHRRGGVHTKIRRRRRSKVWWEQAEMLLSSLWMYDVTRDPQYGMYFLSTLDWIYDRQVDWDAGGWHWHGPRIGVQAREKAGQWKTPYHDGRALLDSLAILSRMEGVV